MPPPFTTTIMAAKTKTEAPALITVRVVSETLFENGERLAKGDTFETTPERAAALGDLVEIVTAD